MSSQTNWLLNLQFKDELNDDDVLKIKKLLNGKIKFSRESGSLSDNLSRNNEIESFHVEYISSNEPQKLQNKLRDHQMSLYALWQSMDGIDSMQAFDPHCLIRLKGELLDIINEFHANRNALPFSQNKKPIKKESETEQPFHEIKKVQIISEKNT